MTVRLLASNRGFVFEVNTVPTGFLASLERRGLASLTARTVDGFYCEPREPLETIIEAIQAAGMILAAVLPSASTRGWRSLARPASSAHLRLTSFRSATWLPTVPA